MSTLPFPDFGSLLRRHRRAAGLTQEELAERAGISEDTISILERGVSRFPHQETVELLAEALRLPPAERAHFSAVARGRLTGPEGLPDLSPFSPTEWESPPVVLAQRLHASRDQLPVPPTPLLGREQEVQTICTLVQSPAIRLLTLTGSAGVGKTRLALQVAREVVDDFPSGVHFISLAALRDPALVLPAIAQSLGLEAVTNRSPLIHLQTYLRDQHLLLVLDNFEQIIPAALQLAEMLSGCPDLHLLVTSREVLHLRVEQQFEVAPLTLPILPSRDRRQPMDWQALAQSPAVQLFVQRAQAVHPEFQLTPGNVSSVAEICIRLDGIPLAIELAAPRIRLLSPQALLARLAGRLQVLSGEDQDLPERQRTLRDTIAWSYDLLTSPDQRLFRRLAIFLDGCTLPAAEAVCQELDQREADLFQEMASLLDKSLVKRVASTEEEPRFLLLEMLREFGLEQLAARGELEATRLAHARYYLHLAEEAFPELSASHQERWLDRLERDEENLRATLVWLVEQGERGHQPMELALRLGGSWSATGCPAGLGGRPWTSWNAPSGAEQACLGACRRERSSVPGIWRSTWATWCKPRRWPGTSVRCARNREIPPTWPGRSRCLEWWRCAAAMLLRRGNCMRRPWRSDGRVGTRRAWPGRSSTWRTRRWLRDWTLAPSPGSPRAWRYFRGAPIRAGRPECWTSWAGSRWSTGTGSLPVRSWKKG
ncbi:MAG TPA: helix-turn-helix domain-containing protein [Ktedonobacterales bacterium]|nr:helix-turn-helix domain-containing protein [Ktedonobacterales bacterium]